VKTRPNLFGHGASAHKLPPFQNKHFLTGPSQVRSAYQAIVSRPYYDYVESLPHPKKILHQKQEATAPKKDTESVDLAAPRSTHHWSRDARLITEVKKEN